MEREILFRGQRADNGEWVYGSPLIIEGKSFIVPTNTKLVTIYGKQHFHWDNLIEVNIEVIPETVGQFNDYHNCYEGDKVMFCWEEDAKGGYFQSSDAYIERKEFGVCVWHNGGFKFKNEKTGKLVSFPAKATAKVIGNIHKAEGGE